MLFQNPAEPVQLNLPRETFNYKNPAHLELIEKQINRFNEAAGALKSLDYNIFLGAAIGSACYFGSYILPLVTISIVGFSLAAHAHAKRPPVYERYRKALEDLISVYNWSMGKDTGDHWYKLGKKTVQDLILTLGPCVAPEVIHTWRAEDLRPNTLNPRNFFSTRRDDIPEEFEKQLAKFAAGIQVSELTYRIYGQHGLDDLWQTLKATVANQVSDTAVKLFNYQPRN